MSTTIDQRVVEMRFDNKQFESNVSSTMSTLDKLKQKLNLTGASKGLEGLNSAAKNVNMNGLGSAVETVTAKFSALQVMGVTALANITNSAVNAGKNIVKSLTIDPIKAGFSEYETKMGSIQTILANTEHQGTTMDQVTTALDELNHYADKTIYNFQEMTRNIGTFTAAGVDLDTSVRSIQGIANLAAVSGSTSQQASTAMYQLSQALATGTVKLMDWNSVVNAGMGGKVFQNALIQTAAMLDGAAADVQAWQQENIDAYGSFRDSLTQGEWLTSEVLTKTLEQFTMAAEEGSKEWEEFKKSLMDDGYTEAQAESILKMANTATDAATKVKTFTQLMDTLKESAQSGWAQTWEILIGDFEEAKEFFTGLSDLFGGIIGDSAERRNNLISGAMSSNWDKMIGKINEAGVETSEFEAALEKIVGKSKLDKLIKDFGSIEKAAKAGKFSSDDLKKAISSLGKETKSAFDFSDMAEKVKGNRFLYHLGTASDDVKKVQNALRELGYDISADGKFGKATYQAVMAFQKASGIKIDGIIGEETIAALEKATGKTEKLTGNVDDLSKSCDDLIDGITQKSGRELLLDSLMNIIHAILKPLQAVGKAWKNTFSLESSQIYKAIKGLNKFTKALVISKETGEKITKTFEGLFAIFKIFTTLTGGVVSIGIRALTTLLNKFDMGILDFTAMIGEALVGISDFINGLIDSGLNWVFDWIGPKLESASEAMSEWVDSIKQSKVAQKILGGLKNIPSVLDRVSQAFSKGVEIVGNWIDKFKETETFQTIAEWIDDASETIKDSISDIKNSIEDFSMSSFMENLRVFGNFVSQIASNISHSEIFVAFVDGICGAFAKLKDFVGGFKMPEFSLDSLTYWTKQLSNLDDKGALGGVSSFIKGFKELSVENFKFKLSTWTNNAITKFAEFWTKSGEKVRQAFDACKKVGLAIKEFIFGTEDVHLSDILNVAEKFLGILVLYQVLKTLQTFVSPFDNVASALDNLATGVKWNAMASGFKSMALALGVLTVCIITIASMNDIKSALAAAGILAGLMIVMGGVIAGIAFAASKVDGGVDAAGAAASLLMVVISIALLVDTLKKIDKTDLKHPVKTFVNLGLVLLALTAGISMISKAGGSTFKSVAAILTLVTALNMILGVIDAFDAYDWTGKSDAIWRMTEMITILAIAVNIASRGLKAGSNASGLALLLLSMVFSLKILIGVINDIAGVPVNDLAKGIGVITLLLSGMTVMGYVLGKASGGSVMRKGYKQVNNFTGLAMALLAVVAAVYLLGKMGDETLLQGGLAVAGVLILFTGMMAALGATCSGLKIGSIITMMIAMGVLMAETAIIIHIMKDIPWEQSVGSAGALALVLGAMAVVFTTIGRINVSGKKAITWIGMLTALGGIVAILGWVLERMKNIAPLSAIGNAVGLSVLLGAMVGVFYALSGLDMRHFSDSKMTKLYKMFAGFSGVLVLLGVVLSIMSALNASNSITNAIGLTVLLGAIAGVLYILSRLDMRHFSAAKMSKLYAMFASFAGILLMLGTVLAIMSGLNTQNAISNALALTVLLAALTGAMTILGMFKGSTVSISTIGSMAVMALGLAAVVYALSKIDGIEAARQNAITLSLLAAVLSPCMILLSVAGLIAMSGSIIPGVAALGIVAATLGVLVWSLSKIDGIETARANAITLANLAVALTACVAVLSVVGLLVPGVIAGTAALVVIAATLGLLVWGLSAIDGIETAKANAATMITLLMALTHVVMLLAPLGTDAIAGVVALGGLVAIVAELGVLATAVGWLSEHIDGLDTFVNSGLDIFIRLAGGLGEMISAFVTNATDNLSETIENIKTFVDGLSDISTTASDIKAESLNGVKSIVGALAGISIGSLVGNFISELAGNSMETFKTNAGKFIDAIVDVSAKLQEVTIDSAAIETITNCGKMFVELNKALPKTGGIAQDLAGEQDLALFATSCKAFANAMIAINTAVSAEGFTVQTEKIEALVAAGEAFNRLNTALPRSGGIAQDLAGEQDLNAFGVACVAFVGSMSAINTAVSAEGFNVQSDKIDALVVAGEAFNRLNTALPKTGGIAQDLAGESDLQAFGASCSAFASAMSDVNAAVSAEGFAIDLTVIDTIRDAGLKFNELQNALPKTGGWWQEIAGESDIADFGSKIEAFGSALATYSESAASIDSAAINTSLNAANRIKTLIASLVDLDASGLASFAGVGMGDGHLVNMGQAIAKYGEEVADLNVEAVSTSVSAAVRLKNLIGSLVGLDTSGIENFKIGSIGTAMKTYANNVADLDPNVVSSSISAANRLKNFIAGLVGIDTSGIVNFKPGSIGTAMRSYANSVAGIDPGAVSSSISAASRLKNFISSLAGFDSSGVAAFKSAINQLSTVDLDGLVSAFAGKADTLGNAARSIIDAMVNGLKGSGGQVSSAMEDIVSKTLNAVRSKTNEFGVIGKTLIGKLASGITSTAGLVKAASSLAASSAASGASSRYPDMYAAGVYLGEGLANGMYVMGDTVYWKGYQLGKAAADGVNKGADNNSPSKKTTQSGIWIGQGLVNGLVSMGRSVYKTGVSMGEDAVNGISKSIRNISDVINSDIDAQPTIRPVLDLSDVRAGASSLSSMFDSNPIGLMTNVGAVSAMMNRRGQNGAESEVVSAITKLRRDLANMPRESYNINGVTYDDGSNIKSFAQAVVHQARLERRV